MTEELKEIGLNVGHRRVGGLMRQNGISVVRTRKHKVTTDSDHKFNIAPNLLERDFNADAFNQKRAGDISYTWTREGWLYLAVILDLHSRRVVMVPFFTDLIVTLQAACLSLAAPAVGSWRE
jgi:transposase InsO family protein